MASSACRRRLALNSLSAVLRASHFVLDGMIANCADCSSSISRPAWRNIKLWVLCSIHSRGFAAAN